MKIKARSHGVTDTVATIASDIDNRKLAFTTDYSSLVPKPVATPPPSRVPLSESEKLGDFYNHGLGMFECSNGQIWKIIKDASGTEFLERDDELTQEATVVSNLMDKQAQAGNFFKGLFGGGAKQPQNPSPKPTEQVAPKPPERQPPATGEGVFDVVINSYETFRQ